MGTDAAPGPYHEQWAHRSPRPKSPPCSLADPTRKPLGAHLRHPPAVRVLTGTTRQGSPTRLCSRPPQGPAALTLEDVLHDRLQHHLLIRVLHQDEPGKVLEDQLLEPGQLLPAGAGVGQRKGSQGCGSGSGRGRAAGGCGGLLTDLQVGASFLSRNGMVICSSASRKKRFRTVLLS